MSYSIKIYESFKELDQESYMDLYHVSNAPVFYHPDFLYAAEIAPLLLYEKVFYVVVFVKDHIMVGFTPLYLQASADSFGILNKTTPFSLQTSESAIFTHIMHCSESKFLIRNNNTYVVKALYNVIQELAINEKAKYCGILNVEDDFLIQTLDDSEIKSYYMWDKFYRNIDNKNSIEEIFVDMTKRARKKFRNHFRRFQADKSATIKIETPSSCSVKSVVQLCHNTAKKYGTESYYPVENFQKFIETCDNYKMAPL